MLPEKLCVITIVEVLFEKVNLTFNISHPRRRAAFPETPSTLTQPACCWAGEEILVAHNIYIYNHHHQSRHLVLLLAPQCTKSKQNSVSLAGSMNRSSRRDFINIQSLSVCLICSRNINARDKFLVRFGILCECFGKRSL